MKSSKLYIFCQDYEEYYQQEEEINVHLNIYATNMQLAYGGVNDVQTQIGYASDARTLQI